MHYVVGDLQGCYEELRRLLDKLSFDDSTDQLTFAGDLVNRGPQSKQALNFIVNHKHCMSAVLGNHDLHFLSIYSGIKRPNRLDTIQSLLDSENIDTLVDWLRKQPLCLEVAHTETNCLVCHAGLYPLWTVSDALLLSAEVSDVLQSDKWHAFLKQMYGNTPLRWGAQNDVVSRRRFIVNAFTRMRFVNQNAHLDFEYKGIAETGQPAGLIPWYEFPSPANKTHKVIFGHWSAIGARHRGSVISLDGGCVYGGTLCALETENLHITSVNASR